MFRRVISVLALAMVLVSVTLASGQSPAATQAAALTPSSRPGV